MTRKKTIIQSLINTKKIDCNLTAIGIMDIDALQQTVADLVKAFPRNFYHTFAVKANPLVNVLKQIQEYGMGAEVASSGELMLALKAGFSSERIIYDSPAKTMADLRTCFKSGISINIDNLQELYRIDQLMLEYPSTKSIIGFRINPQIGAGIISSTSTATATSKFGYSLTDANNRQDLINIYQQRPWLTSIHTHSGSQGCSLDLMATGIKAITELAEQINDFIGRQQIAQIDIGGGLPVNFSSEEITPTFKEYADRLEADVPLLFSGKYQVKTEFGRTIVAKNGFIVTRVEYTKQSGGRHIAITHAGAQILTRTAFLPDSWPLRVSAFSPSGEEKTAATNKIVATDIGGPCCFAGDLVCVNQQIPELAPDDYVIVHDTGGYYFSNHFDYNSLPRVAIYAVSGAGEQLNANCIRKADTLDDIINKM